jgi:hypothetical protein
MIILRCTFSNLPEPTAFGNITMKCGVYFLNSELEKTWSDAKQYCCDVGMNLVSVFSLEKQHCLYDLLSKRTFD